MSTEILQEIDVGKLNFSVSPQPSTGNSLEIRNSSCSVVGWTPLITKEIPLLVEHPFGFKPSVQPNSMSFHNSSSKEVARIDADGTMRFSIDATDENAILFVSLMEMYLKRRLTGIEVTTKSADDAQRID